MGIEETIKQGKFKQSFEKAIVNLIYTSNWLRDKQMEIFKPANITPQHYNVLRILRGRSPQPCAAWEIKEVMLDKSPDLTRLVDKLQAKGLVNRGLCEQNRRQMDITITDKGLEFLSTIEKKLEAQMVGLNKITKEEAEQLSGILDKLRG